MRIHNFRARFQWWLAVLAWTGAAAVLGVLAGGLFGLLCGVLLGAVRNDMALVLVLAGRGAIAGLGTGAIMGMLAKIIGEDSGAEEPKPADSSEQQGHPSSNGTMGISGLHRSKPRISSR